MAAYDLVVNPLDEGELSLELLQRRRLTARAKRLPRREINIHETTSGLLRVTALTDKERTALWQTASVVSPDFKADVDALQELDDEGTLTYPARLERVGNVALSGGSDQLPPDAVLPDARCFSIHDGLQLVHVFGRGMFDPEFLDTTERLQCEIAQIVEARLLAVHGLDLAYLNNWLASQR